MLIILVLKKVALISIILIIFPYSFPLEDSNDYTPHPPIFINGNDDFTWENGVVSGNGTKGNPYIIEGWEINASGVYYGIFIWNTDAYFIIRNCYIHDSKIGAVIFINVSNAVLQGIITKRNVNGIEIGFCKNICIEECYTENMFLQCKNARVMKCFCDEIIVYSSTNYSIERCKIKNSFVIRDSSNGKVSDNSVENKGFIIRGYRYEHFMHFMSNNTVQGKPIVYCMGKENFTIEGNESQIFLMNCRNVEIKNKNFSNLSVGIEIAYSKNISISNCNFCNCGKFETFGSIFLINSSSISISNSSFEKCDYSISIFATHNFLIKNCSFAKFETGLLAKSSKKGIILNCIFHDGEIGIEIYSCTNIKIRYCSMYNNGFVGVMVITTIGLLISKCNIYNNGYGDGGGIVIGQSLAEIHFNNIFNNAYYGLYTEYSIVNAIYNYWGSFLGPSRNRVLHMRGDIIYGFMAITLTFPWKFLPFSPINQKIIYTTFQNNIGPGVGGRLTAYAEEIPPSFLGQGRKSQGESPDGWSRNDTAQGEDDSLRMTLPWDLVKRPPPWSKSKYRGR